MEQKIENSTIDDSERKNSKLKHWMNALSVLSTLSIIGFFIILLSASGPFSIYANGLQITYTISTILWLGITILLDIRNNNVSTTAKKKTLKSYYYLEILLLILMIIIFVLMPPDFSNPTDYVATIVVVSFWLGIAIQLYKENKCVNK